MILLGFLINFILLLSIILFFNQILFSDILVLFHVYLFQILILNTQKEFPPLLTVISKNDMGFRKSSNSELESMKKHIVDDSNDQSLKRLRKRGTENNIAISLTVFFDQMSEFTFMSNCFHCNIKFDNNLSFSVFYFLISFRLHKIHSQIQI